jgi:hypothetical protein
MSYPLKKSKQRGAGRVERCGRGLGVVVLGALRGGGNLEPRRDGRELGVCADALHVHEGPDASS